MYLNFDLGSYSNKLTTQPPPLLVSLDLTSRVNSEALNKDVYSQESIQLTPKVLSV